MNTYTPNYTTLNFIPYSYQYTQNESQQLQANQQAALDRAQAKLNGELHQQLATDNGTNWIYPVLSAEEVAGMNVITRTGRGYQPNTLRWESNPYSETLSQEQIDKALEMMRVYQEIYQVQQYQQQLQDQAKAKLKAEKEFQEKWEKIVFNHALSQQAPPEKPILNRTKNLLKLFRKK